MRIISGTVPINLMMGVIIPMRTFYSRLFTVTNQLVTENDDGDETEEYVVDDYFYRERKII